VKNDLIEADISIEDFFKFLIENRFISVEQTKKIFEFLASKNIFLSERVDTVFELFDQYNIFIEINTSSLFEILDRLDITLSIESELFQEIVSRVLISLDFSIDEIISLFRHLNIKSKLSVEKFNRIIGNLRHIFNLTIDRIKKDVASDGVLSEISARQSKLRLEQEVNRRIVKIGDELRYTIRYSNFGEEDASRVLLIQVLPPGADYFGKKKKKNLEYVVLENGLKCLVWNIGKKLKSGSKPREVEYQIRVNDFNSGHK
jgi:uncharacterized repeat protein (TIGR01451 family)